MDNSKASKIAKRLQYNMMFTAQCTECQHSHSITDQETPHDAAKILAANGWSWNFDGLVCPGCSKAIAEGELDNHARAF